LKQACRTGYNLKSYKMAARLAIGVKCGSKLHFTALEALEPDSCSVSSNRRFRHREPPLAIVSGGRFASCACPQANTVTGDGPQSQKAHSPVNLLAYIALRLRIISDDPVLRPRSKANTRTVGSTGRTAACPPITDLSMRV